MLVRKRGLWELLLSVIVLWVTYLGSVLLHELGHALVARAVGLHPIVLVSGTGPRLRARVAGIALNLGLVPAGGLVRVVSERCRGNTARQTQCQPTLSRRDHESASVSEQEAPLD